MSSEYEIDVNNFGVVVFEDNTVSVVPKNWIIDDTSCLYPNYRNEKKIRKAIQNQTSPEEDWKNCNVTILGIYESITIADEHAENAVATAEGTVVDIKEEKTKKRTRIKKSYGSDFEVDNDEENNSSPDKNNTESQYPIKNANQLDKEKSFIDRELSEPDENFSKDPISSTPPKQEKLVKRKRTRKMNNSDDDDMPKIKKNKNVICCPCSGIVRTLIKQMADMQHNMNILLGMLDSVPVTGTEYDDMIKQKRNYHEVEKFFPFKTIPEVMEVENMIATDAEKRSKIENFLKSFGGKMYDLPVNNILCNIFTNQVAVQFCYEGRNKAKLAAASLRIISLIRDAVLDTCKGSTRNAIKMKMMQWFKDAKKRMAIKEMATAKNFNQTIENSIED